MARYWTLAEARAALPEVVALLKRLQAAVGMVSARENAPGAGSTVNGHALPPRREDPQALLDEINARGVQVKDLQTGLIDFPHLRRNEDGADEEVLLCYRLGEPDILFWHDLRTGFAGRRPVDEL